MDFNMTNGTLFLHDFNETFPDIYRRQFSNMTNETLFLHDFNETFPDIYRRKFPMRILGSAFTLFVGLVAIVGNLAVVAASYWDEELRSQASNLLLVYLSMTDVVTGLFLIIPTAVSVALDYFPFGHTFCKLQNGLAYSCSCSSSFNISFISVDRFVGVTRPLQYSLIMHHKRIVQLCVFLFLLGLSILLPILILDWTHFNYVDGLCGVDWDFPEARLFTSFWNMVSCYYVPALCMLFCNGWIILAARRKNTIKLFVPNRGNLAPASGDSGMNKIITSVVVLVATYCISLSPYLISTNLQFSIEGFHVSPKFYYFASLIFFVSSAANPFIYGIFRKDYRTAYKRMVRKASNSLRRWN